MIRVEKFPTCSEFSSKWETVSGEIPGNAIEFIYTAII